MSNSALIQAWASHKRFRPKDQDSKDSLGSGRNAEINFTGEKHLKETHESTTDPDARNYKKPKGGESRLAYPGHSVIENRNGLIVNAKASGRAEREAAIELSSELPGKQPKTVGADKNYDTKDFAAACRQRKVTPHVRGIKLV